MRPLLEALRAELSFLEPQGILIGHSFGGLLALCLAAENSSRISSLVLLEPAIIPSAWLARRAARKYRDEVVTTRRDEFDNWSGSFRRLHDPERYPRWAIDHYLANRREIDPEIMCALLDDLPSLYPLPFERVTMPVLVLRGASSGMWVRFGVSRLQRRLPRAAQASVEGAAHWMINEQDEAIAGAIEAFVHSNP
jgi:pimeloyl-ACP methyl ester carboxylesterase